MEVRNPRADVYDIDIENVEWDGNDVHVDYRYSWHVYNGCDNMDEQDDEYEAVHGKQDGDRLVFERHVAPEKLSPSEEL